MGYKPPFTVTATSINLISDISALLERIKINSAGKDSVRLRKVNRMKTIRGSLAIEGNTLSEEQVTALIEGSHVIAPMKEVQEVRNAINAYESFNSFNPLEVTDLLSAHRMMSAGLVDNPGCFRNGDVCVSGDGGIRHIAPPADVVATLMDNLFEWLKTSGDHALVKSCVFHYEFEFIHPFEDGNGRMGRFWQSRILCLWNPVFANIPVENMIWENQRGYYAAIERSNEDGDAGNFIEFMLGLILQTLRRCVKDDTVNDTVNDTVRQILRFIRENPSISYEELSAKVGKSRATVSRMILSLKADGTIGRVGSAKKGMWKILK